MKRNDAVRRSETAIVTKPAKYLKPNMELRNVCPETRSEPALRWMRPELKAIASLQLRGSVCVLFSDSGSLEISQIWRKSLMGNYRVRHMIGTARITLLYVDRFECEGY